MKRTLPQIIMLNFEAWRVNREIELKYEDKKTKKDNADPFIPEMGMKMSEIEKDPAALSAYLGDWSAFT